MSRLFIHSEKGWCHKLNDVDYYSESRYESMLLQHIRAIFPDFITITFKRNIKDGSGRKKKPDLVLLRNDLKAWWIVEVEKSTHHINHVKDQVTIFLNGDYTDYAGLARYISKQIKDEHPTKNVSSKKILELVRNTVPSVLIIVDTDKAEWEKEFQRMNVDVCVFEIYRNTKSQYSYRLYGKYPYVVEKESPCRFDQDIPRVLQVVRSSILTGKVGKIEIIYNGDAAKWEIFRTRHKVYISYIGSNIPLTPMNTFILRKGRRSRFFLERS